MNTVLRIVVALLAGLVAFAVAAVAVTALFSPLIEFSLFVGLPVGLWTGFAAALLASALLWYRERDPAADEPADRFVTAVLWVAVAVAADVVVVFALGTAWYFLLGGSGALGLLIFGIPLTMVVAAVLGYAAFRLATRENGGRGGSDRDREPDSGGDDPNGGGSPEGPSSGSPVE